MDINTYLNSQVQGSGGTSQTAPVAAAGKKDLSQLNGKDFMTMMLAQIKYQDPMSPTDTSQQLAQLAQLSSVTGINEMKASLDQLVTSINSAQMVNASSLIGREVMVSGSSVQHAAGSTLQGDMTLPYSSPSVGIDIVSPSGELVRHLDLGAQSAGKVAFSWDGLDASGKPAAAGSYTLKAGYSAGSTQQSLDTRIKATVQSVTLPSASGGSMQLQVEGIGPVNLADIQSVG